MTKLSVKQLKKKIDTLFYWFEANKFKNEGNYPRATNLVLEFSDYVEKMDNCNLADSLGLTSDFDDLEDAEKAAAHARTMIDKGIDNWLGA